MSNAPRLLTVLEVAAMFRANAEREDKKDKTGKRWVYWAANQGALRSCVRKVGRKLLFDRVAIEKLIEELARK